MVYGPSVKKFVTGNGRGLKKIPLDVVREIYTKGRLPSESTRGWKRAYVRYQLGQGADRGMSGDLPFNNVAGTPPAEGLNIEMGNSIGSGCLEEISYLSKTSTEASKF